MHILKLMRAACWKLYWDTGNKSLVRLLDSQHNKVNIVQVNRLISCVMTGCEKRIIGSIRKD